MNSSSRQWQFWIDRGGTFTDIVAYRPDGQVIAHKLLSDNPEIYSDAALQGIRDLFGLPPDRPIPHDQIAAVKMGTTVGTNALLERTGERTVLVINQGFGDCLRIGYQNRPDIFALNIELPEMLYESIIEVEGRYDAQGGELVPLNKSKARIALQAVYDKGVRSVAIVFMHAWKTADHELAIAEITREIGFTQISMSHRISPLMKIVSRGDTTVVDAYLSPLLRRYVDQVSAGIKGNQFLAEGKSEQLDEASSSAEISKEAPNPRLMFMQSNGGLVDAEHFQGKDSILSGPAGGIVGAVATSVTAGFKKIITFDMGGTSTDVAHFAGEFERTLESEVAGVRMRVPMMHIHTIAAGGGSVLRYDGMRFRVGPDSGGANPGPACYRRGGPLCVTDANVLLGKLPAEFFPKVFGPEGNLSIDADRVKEKFTELCERVNHGATRKFTPEGIAEGFIAIAVENMASAIKKISIQRGYDVTGYTLCCFGGAAGQHACKVADNLGVTRIFLHLHAGVLSAYGMGLADFRIIRQQAVEEDLVESIMVDLDPRYIELEADGRGEMTDQGVDGERIETVRRIHLRYAGTDTALTLEHAAYARIIESFEEMHHDRFGFVYPDKKLIIEAVSVEVIGRTARPQEPDVPLRQGFQNEVSAVVRMFTDGGYHDTPVFHRESLCPERPVSGPAIIIDNTSTGVVEPGWQAELSRQGHLLLTRAKVLPRQLAAGTEVDPVMLEIFNNLFRSIAEQMGFTLQNTAYSVNIKERLDFSCAIFDQRGELVANAPHIPVHLGSMGESVQALIREQGGNFRPGDVFLSNSPYVGGTHLPDITVISPVFDRRQKDILFYVASRGHHADIGGITPGSMPPASRDIEEEGLLSGALKIVEAGLFLEDSVLEWLSESDYPARNPSQNIADLRAQIASNEKGAQGLRGMVEQYSLATVRAYMNHVQDNAAEAVRRALDSLKNGEFSYAMDNGARINAAIRIDRQRRTACIDFSGTSEQQANNLNAPEAVCKAAVLYVFRTLVQDDIPLNAGCLRPLEIIIPEGSMLHPRYPAAVVAGNVETSQYIVDALYGAMGVMAASQGTMNNLTFGNREFQYYETICGGAGAGPTFKGSDAVHTHMTNSRITDPEILEARFPVIVEKFAIRQGTGGAGQFFGGNGVLRRIRFLCAMTTAILSSHRVFPPFGVKSGKPGALGSNRLERADGQFIDLAGCDQVEVGPGDVVVIETPGGGGYGSVD